MSLVFKRIQTEGIAELSYLIGDDSAGVAAVVDPTPDVDKYVTLAREHGVRSLISSSSSPASVTRHQVRRGSR
jgi:hypothetical protein